MTTNRNAMLMRPFVNLSATRTFAVAHQLKLAIWQLMAGAYRKVRSWCAIATNDQAERPERE